MNFNNNNSNRINDELNVNIDNNNSDSVTFDSLMSPLPISPKSSLIQMNLNLPPPPSQQQQQVTTSPMPLLNQTSGLIQSQNNNTRINNTSMRGG